MLFNSLAFWIFFAVVALLFGLIPRKYRWYLLLAASLFFIAYALPVGLLYILSVVLIAWICSIQIEKLSLAACGAENDRRVIRKKRLLLVAELIACFGVLFVLKYFNFFASLVPNIDRFLSIPIRFAIPLGLSFYTFQLTGYAIDVYRSVVPAQKNLAKLLLFTAYFPQMIEGPISRYHEISGALYDPGDVTYERGRNALRLFTWGLFKKVCIADNLSVYVDHLFDNYSLYSGLMILSAGIAYFIYLYADFSGCIDMARAVSDYFGISLKCNFRRPFYSRSIKEYWRRWHITLGAWFRDYIYIPLGGNRRGLPVQIRNLLIVWLFTGLWHGANGTFIVFGLIHGFIMIFSLVCEKLLPGKKEVKRPLLRKWLEIVRTFLLVSFLFLIFRAPSLSVAWEMIRRLFDFRHFFVIKQASLAYRTFLSGLGGMPYLLITLVGLALLLRHDVLTEHGKDPLRCVSKLPKPIKYLLSMLTVLFLLFMINRSAGHFTYMQF